METDRNNREDRTRRQAIAGSLADRVATRVRAKPRPQGGQRRMTATVKTIETDVLSISYLEYGSASGWPCIMGHGFPYDAHAYDQAAPILAQAGARVIVPYLRGYGPTRFLEQRRRVPASRRRSARTFSTSWTRLRSSARFSAAMIGAAARPASSPRFGPSGSSRWSPAIRTTSRTSRMRWSRRARPRRRRSGINIIFTTSGAGVA